MYFDLFLSIQVMFQGFDGSDTVHFVLLYNVTIDAGCCQDPCKDSTAECGGIVDVVCILCCNHPC